jgi:hypothetical protein
MKYLPLNLAKEEEVRRLSSEAVKTWPARKEKAA